MGDHKSNKDLVLWLRAFARGVQASDEPTHGNDEGLNLAAARIEELEANNLKLLIDLTEARMALEPFARQAGIFDPYEVHPMKFVYTEDFEPFDLADFGTRIKGLTVGDIRRARSTVAGDA